MKIDTILTKSVSRFGRNTVETISLLRELRAIGVRVIFENTPLLPQDFFCDMEYDCENSVWDEVKN